MSNGYNSDNDSLFSLEDAFDCDALCVVTQEVNGKTVEGWTCAYCPCLNDGSHIFHQHANPWTALVHILKLRGYGVKTCKGNIPFGKGKKSHALWVNVYNSGYCSSHYTRLSIKRQNWYFHKNFK